MENINVTINRETRMVNLSKVTLGNDGENLQENLVFSFSDEFVDGTGRLEMTMPNDTSSYVMLSKVDNTYQIPVRSIMTEEGKISMQLVITEGTNEEDIPVFKSNVFSLKVRKSINAEIEEPEGYAQWIDIANTKLNQIDNLDITAEKVDTATTITITKKDGTTETTQVLDGNGIASITTQESQVDEGNNAITITDTNGQVTTFIVKNGSKGNTGAPGQIKMLIVNELPLTGSGDTLYFVPKSNPEQKDLYDEYAWVNNDWERLGEKRIVIDLSDYYTKQETNTLLNGKVDNSTLNNYALKNELPTKTSDLTNDSDFTTKTYVDGLVGDISSAIDLINGESV